MTLEVKVDPIWIAIAGSSATLVVGYLSYLGARRLNSGNVSTSSAENLWKAAEEIRTEQRVEIKRQRIEIERQRNEINELKKEVRGLRIRVEQLEDLLEIGRVNE